MSYIMLCNCCKIFLVQTSFKLCSFFMMEDTTCSNFLFRIIISTCSRHQNFLSVYFFSGTMCLIKASEILNRFLLTGPRRVISIIQWNVKMISNNILIESKIYMTLRQRSLVVLLSLPCKGNFFFLIFTDLLIFSDLTFFSDRTNNPSSDWGDILCF